MKQIFFGNSKNYGKFLEFSKNFFKKFQKARKYFRIFKKLAYTQKICQNNRSKLKSIKKAKKVMEERVGVLWGCGWGAKNEDGLRKLLC